MQLSDIGRCTAASTARSSADAFCANAVVEGPFGQPDQTVAVRCKLWRLGMGFEAIEHVCDLLALVGSKSGYVDQRLDAFGACESDDRTGIGVSRQHDRPFGPVQAAVEGGHVVGKRGQRKRRRRTPSRPLP